MSAETELRRLAGSAAPAVWVPTATLAAYFDALDLEARAAELDAAALDDGPYAVGFGLALAELEAAGAIRIEEAHDGE